MRHAKMREISARVFFVKIPKSQDSMIYTIFSFFRIHIPKIESFANAPISIHVHIHIHIHMHIHIQIHIPYMGPGRAAGSGADGRAAGPGPM